MEPILVNENGEKIADLWRSTSGSPMLPREGEVVVLKDDEVVTEFVVFLVRWDFFLGEIQVFVRPNPEKNADAEKG